MNSAKETSGAVDTFTLRSKRDLHRDADALFGVAVRYAIADCNREVPRAIASGEYRFYVTMQPRGYDFGKRVARDVERQLRESGWDKATVDWWTSSSDYGDMDYLSVYLVERVRPRPWWSRLFGGAR